MATGRESFWYGKNVLITGGDGFVASNLASTLINLDANVVVAVRHSRPVSTMRLVAADGPPPDIEMSDLSDLITVRKICDRHQIDTIFHLAASAIVSSAANAPLTTLENNVVPTLNLLETTRINEIPRVIIASSDKSYGDHADPDDPEPIPYREAYALRGLDVYSASKVCADVITQTYALQFNLPVLVVRSCNIYGPGDLNFTRLIPRSIMRLLLDIPAVINEGNADVLREYIFVDDVVRAYMFLAEHIAKQYLDPSAVPRTGHSTYGWCAYNVGSYRFPQAAKVQPAEHPNIESVVGVIELLQRKLGKEHVVSTVNPKPANFIEIPDQYLDSTKFLDLGFEPRVDLDAGIDLTIQWYQQHREALLRVGWSYMKDS